MPDDRKEFFVTNVTPYQRGFYDADVTFHDLPAGYTTNRAVPFTDGGLADVKATGYFRFDAKAPDAVDLKADTGAPAPYETPPGDPKEEKLDDGLDDLNDDDLRATVETLTGKKPHHNLGREKLLALARGEKPED